MKRWLTGAALAGVGLATSCVNDLPNAPPVTPPAMEIRDASHGNGNSHFYFLPPLVPDTDHNGAFDPSANPVVRICRWSAEAGCATPLIAEYTTRSGTKGEQISVEEEEIEVVKVKVKRQLYVVKWETDEFDLTPGATYRIQVLVAGTVLGFADVILGNDRRELRNVNTDEFVPLVDGKTLRIRFRIEQGAVFVLGPDGGTVHSDDGNVTVTVPPGMFSGPFGLTMQPAPLSADEYTASGLVPGTGYEFGPSGPLPAPGLTVQLRYDPARLGGLDPGRLTLVTKLGDKWAEIPNPVVDQTNHTVSATVIHFSTIYIGTITTATISPRGFPLVRGTTKPLTGTVGNNRVIVWSSTNPAVATVDQDGNVTGISDGVATITLGSFDPAYTYGYVDAVTVRVVEPGEFAWTKQKEGYVLNTLLGVGGTSNTNIYAVGTTGTILHYTGGQNGTTDNSGTTQILRGVAARASNDVYAVGGNAFGSGVVLHYDGSAWSSLSTAPEHPVFFGVAVNARYAFAVGQRGQVYRYPTGSSTPDPPITPIATTSPIAYRGVAVKDAHVVVVGFIGSTGVVAQSFDDGATWTQWTPPTNVANVGPLNAVWMDQRASQIFVAGDDGSTAPSGPFGLVIGSGDDGNGWVGENTTFPPFRSIASNSGGLQSQDVYLGGDQGTVVAAERCLCGFAGAGTLIPSSQTFQSVQGLWTDPNGMIWGVGQGGLVLRQNGPGGHTFDVQALGEAFSDVWGMGDGTALAASATINTQVFQTSASAVGGWFATLLEWNGNGLNGLHGDSTAGVVYAVGPSGTAYRRQLAGTLLWTRLTTPTTQHLTDVWVSRSGIAYAVGNAGTVLRTANGGASWAGVASGLPASVDIVQVWGLGDNDVIVGASDGSIYHTTNGGGGWTQMRVGPGGQYILGLWASDATHIFASAQDAGAGNGVLIYTNDGSNWQEYHRDGTRYLAGAWGTSPSDVFVAGSAGTVLHVGFDQNNSLFVVPQDTKVTHDLWAVYGAGPNVVYAVGSAGTITTGARP